MILTAPVAVLIALSAQSGQKEFNIAYGSQINKIKEKYSAMGDIATQNKQIIRDLTVQREKKEKLTDTIVLGTSYRLLYRAYYLGYSTDDEVVTYWKSTCRTSLSALKESIEKEICKAYFDFNDSSWMFDRYPDWKKSPILTMLCFANSAYGVNGQQRYDLFKSAYESAIAEVGPTYRKIGFDAAMSVGTYFYSKDKKYLREYIDLLRLYATKTPDKGSAERATKMANQFEEWNFGKKAGG